MSNADDTHRPERARVGHVAALCLGALGVVYGDIGTSPLYAFRECFSGSHGVVPDPGNVLGVLSLVFWTLIVVVTLKYLLYVLRMDNRGEGGILALMSLLVPRGGPDAQRRLVVIAMGLFGAALLYGDGMITPAISVLSAVEGLEVATPLFAPYVVPATVAILVGLFLVQRHGTARIGAVFGSVMTLWFATLAVLGVSGILRDPSVLAAVNPVHAARFFAGNGGHGFLVLGAVFLVTTGGEALYADLGHFGARPIRADWFLVVLPALLLNYFGQGALLLHEPEAAANPFFLLAPSWALYPLVGMATLATVIASQAVISGAFSLTRQAVQLGYLPRMTIVHTSASEIGQIYIPAVNWALMAATVGLVLGFKRSGNLAAAYGVAVTTTMVVTTLLAFAVARARLRWSAWAAALVTGAFLLGDLAFFGANMVKVPQGGWFPLVVAAVVFVVMTTWIRGRRILATRLAEGTVPMDLFLAGLAAQPLRRVPGTAVFLSGAAGRTPPSLLHNFKHNKILHDRVVLLTVITEDSPHLRGEERSEVEELGEGFFRVLLRYGFMESPDVPRALRDLGHPGLDFPPASTSFFLGKETVLSTQRPGMARWRERLFAFMSRNSQAATAFFNLPANRVVELGAQVEI
ncbi:MAG: potassium transporter Kup [Acidobacteriota bacterium]